MNEKYIIGIVTLLAFLTIAMTTLPGKQVSSDNSIKYGSMVCVYKNNELVGPCKHNLFTSWGKNWTRDLIGNWEGGGQAMKYIGIANVSTGCVDANSLNGLTDAGALDTATNPVAGGYAVNTVSAGNWTISKVFTAQETINNVNATGLYNTTSEQLMFACNNFSSVSLLQNDQINVTWYIWVT